MECERRAPRLMHNMGRKMQVEEGNGESCVVRAHLVDFET